MSHEWKTAKETQVAQSITLSKNSSTINKTPVVKHSIEAIFNMKIILKRIHPEETAKYSETSPEQKEDKV